jgi:hypothetical protein
MRRPHLPLPETPSTLPCWELTPPDLPPRSQLYPLPPRGLHTPLVESLSSYVCRLAHEHHVYPGTLIRYLIAPLIAKPYLVAGRSSSISGFLRLATPINGNSIMAQDWVRALTALTLRHDLRHLTLLAWSEALSERGLLQKTRRWCPACYAAWKEARVPIYEPLLWIIEGVSACPEHHCALETRCLRCQQGSSWLAWRARPGYCLLCGAWLGGPTTVLSGTGGQERVRIAEWAGAVFVHAATMTSPVPRVSFTTALASLVSRRMQGNVAAFARRVGVPKTTMWELAAGTFPPQLPMLLRLCLHLQVSLLDLLTGEGKSTSATLEPLPPPVERAMPHPRRAFEVDQMRRQLETILADTTSEPRSLRAVARDLGYPPKTLDTHLHDLCQAITRRYQVYRSAKGAERVETLRQQIRTAARELHAQGISPTYQHVGAALGTPGCFREQAARDALHQAEFELNWQYGEQSIQRPAASENGKQHSAQNAS